jgi:hypothetical protein
MANPHQPTKPATSGSRGQNEGIGTENDPSGTPPPDPRKAHGREEGLGTKNEPSGPPAPAKKGPEDFVKSDEPQKPVSSGPTVADADAPVVEGHEGAEYETVRLTDGPIGPDDGVKVRVATPLPLVVVSGGRRYVRSTKDLYVIQMP